MKKVKVIVMVWLASIILAGSCTDKSPRLGEDLVDRVISTMTLKDKAILVVGTGMYFELPDSLKESFSGMMGQGQDLAEFDSSYAEMVNRIRKMVPGAAGRTAAIPELGIPATVLADGPAGLRISPTRGNDSSTYYCTAFPIATVMASTWDTELVREVGEAMGNEVLEYGADVLLAPGMNLQRDPLCGRNFEYYSEDPLITGKMAAAMVNGVQSRGVGTSIKHFAANNQETNRNTSNSVVTERALREMYLEGFRIAVEEAQPWTVMSSYNKINGTYTSESHDLLTRILRDDWGFNGYVMTDWTGGTDVVAQMKAGNDLLMPGNPEQIREIIAAVEEGRLDEEVLDRNVKRILDIIVETPNFRDYQNSNDPDLEAHARLTRRAASEGMVLLKNDRQALPISESAEEVALFGTTSYEIVIGGTGSGDVNEAYSVFLMEGLTGADYELTGSLKDRYLSYIKKTRESIPKPDNPLAAMFMGMPPIPEMPVSKDMVEQLANESDVAVITIGRNSGEGGDRKPEQGDFYLTDRESELIQTVSQAFQARDKKAIVVLNVGGVVETDSWKQYPDAILLAWQPGQEAGNSVAEVLSGKVNPSGKLAVTFPLTYSDVPSSESFPGHEVEKAKTEEEEAEEVNSFFGRRVPWEIIYNDDIYVGYRYYSTFDVPVSYEFGYGLSYTDFEYNNMNQSSDSFGGELTVSVDIKNTGSVAGREVAQVYLGAPEGKLKKPAMELVSFGKTRALDPGESQTLSFVLDSMDLASFDASASSWIAEPGTYNIHIGASSQDIRQSGSFTLDKEMVVERVSKALEPEREFETLKPE